MGINNEYKDVIESFQSVKLNAIDFSFRAMTILIGPLYAYGLYYGYPKLVIPFILNLLILFLLVGFNLFGQHISLKIKKYILLFIILYSNLFSIYDLGFFGGAQYFMILLFGLTIFYFNAWFALIVNVGAVAYYFTFMYLYTSGIMTYYSPPHILVNSKVVWIADFNLTILTIAIGGYALHKAFRAYKKKVSEQIESQKQFNYTLDNMPIPVAALTVDKKITYFNEEFYKYFGYEVGEIPTFDHWLELSYPKDEKRQKLAKSVKVEMDNGFATQKQLPLEFIDLRTKNGTIKSVEVHHMFLGDTAVCAFIDLTERRKKRRFVVETMIQAEEKEKKRIAQELHDGVGPLLSTAKIYAHSLKNTSDGADKELFGAKLTELLDNSIKELRNTINNVSPQILQKYGLIRAIDSFIKNITPITTVEFAFEAKDIRFKLPMVELAIYRSLIELINNSIKYGSPKIISISIEKTDDALKVIYTDDGIGFDFEKERMNGFGLSNIINRVETIGGVFIMKTSIGQGVAVEIEFDLKIVET